MRKRIRGYPAKMHIELLERSGSEIIAQEDSSGGEFYLRPDGSVWYRNALAPGEDCFVNSSRSDFLRAVEALYRYNADVVTTEVEEEQMVFVRRLADELRREAVVPVESFWPLIVEQAEDGMM